MQKLIPLCVSLGLFGCASPSPDRLSLALAPDLVSSESGSFTATATVLDGNTELHGWMVKLHVAYTDRNNVMHAVDDASDKSDTIGMVKASFTGLKWEGAGTLTASLLDQMGNPALDAKKNPITADATFAVVDQSPPTVTITSPASGAHIIHGTRLSVQVSATDEIGVSQIYVQAVTTAENTSLDRTRSTILATGSTTGTAQFDFDTGNISPGTNVTIYAMAADMSGNLAVASSISITID